MKTGIGRQPYALTRAQRLGIADLWIRRSLPDAEPALALSLAMSISWAAKLNSQTTRMQGAFGKASSERLGCWEVEIHRCPDPRRPAAWSDLSDEEREGVEQRGEALQSALEDLIHDPDQGVLDLTSATVASIAAECRRQGFVSLEFSVRDGKEIFQVKARSRFRLSMWIEAAFNGLRKKVDRVLGEKRLPLHELLSRHRDGRATITRLEFSRTTDSRGSDA